MHEGMSLSHVLGNAGAILQLCRDNSETYCNTGWIIELGPTLDTAGNGGFTTRSARSGGLS